MSQVSKRHLHKETKERVLDLFWTSLASLSSKQDIADLLDDLLSPTEKLMLGKRLSIAFMILKGYDYETINQRLKVSNPTIWNVKLNLAYKGTGYKRTIERIMNKEKWESFWNDLDNFFTRVLPPRKGTNWRDARRKQWNKRRAQQKPF